MGTTSTGRAARLATAVGASAVVILLGAGPAAAQDQHSGGVSPNAVAVDANQVAVEPAAVLGQSQTAGGGLPVTGSDVAGLVGMGAVAVAVGVGAVAASRRHNHISA